MKADAMNASTTETTNRPRCHGTGSGLENDDFTESTREFRDGAGLDGLARVPTVPAVLGEPRS
jgi:hypothetical protein